MLKLDDTASRDLRTMFEEVLAWRERSRDVSLDAFEVGVREALNGVGRALMKERMESSTPSVAFVEHGMRWSVAVVSNADVLSSFGPFVASRPLFRKERNGRTRDVMAERCGMVFDLWTPAAAKLGALAVTEMPLARAEAFFAVAGVVMASKSSLHRLVGDLSESWEVERERNEEVVREQAAIPPEAATVAVSLDGVMLMMVGSDKAITKSSARDEGRPDKGPAGFKEASVGVVAFYDGSGRRLGTRRYARMPEEDKATTKAWLTEELAHVRKLRPDIVTMAMADGAPNNWSFLETLETDHEIVDFFHTAEHLHRHVSKANGASTVETQKKLADMRRRLLCVPGGAADVFADMKALREAALKDAQQPASEVPNAPPKPKRKGRAQPDYFEMHHGRMAYTEAREKQLPIGTGVTESTCKLAVCDRMRRTGMRWGARGGQGVMTLRALHICGTFDAAWTRLMAINQDRLHRRAA